MIESFLLIGQSNMAGRGFLEEAVPVDSTHIQMLRNGCWQPMHRPINPDRWYAGVSLAESFAECYAREHKVDVGLIPCADGGSSLEQWRVGGILFDHACYMAELAARTSKIMGILWHQGESDCSNELHPLYRDRLNDILEAFRERLKLHDVPILVGGLGDYLSNYPNPEFQNYVHINKALRDLADTNPRIGFVSAEGLFPNPDNLHFNAKSLHEFGIRYYKEFLELEGQGKR